MSSSSPTSVSEITGNMATGSTISQSDRPALCRRHSPLKINELVDNSSDSQVEQIYQNTEAASSEKQSGILPATSFSIQNIGGNEPTVSAETHHAPCSGRHSSSEVNSTILDKVTSHPLITSSINYMLERTIHTSSNYLQETQASQSTSEDVQQAQQSDVNIQGERAKRARSSITIFDNSPQTIAKRPKLSSSSQGTLLSENKLPPPIPTSYRTGIQTDQSINKTPWQVSHAVLPRIGPDLRQQVTINSAISAQRSLQDLTELSVINLNIESRRRLEMLIHFLKLGNGQLSERIENLIRQVETRRQESRRSSTVSSENSDETASSDGSTFATESYSQFISDDSVQQIKNDIVTTVKKIVNVVSKVSASSMSEPARSNVREILLKLPSNWAAMFEKEKRQGGDNSEDLESSSSEDENGDSTGKDDDASSVDTRYEDSMEFQKADQKKADQSSFTPSLLSNLFRYKGGLGRSTMTSLKARKWFRRKIRSQMSYDTNGKVLVLAQESLDMINKIIKFCNENLDKAETWNSSKQVQQRENLRSKLEDMEYVSAPSGGADEVATITVKHGADKPQ